MKRKIVAALAALSILFSILPDSALAVEDDAEEVGAFPLEVEDSGEDISIQEETLEDAVLMEVDYDNYMLVASAEELIAAFARGQENEVNIRLEADVALENSQAVYGHVDLDLNGHTLTVSPQYGNWSFALGIEPGAAVSIANGSIVCNSAETYAIAVHGGTLTLEGVSVTGPAAVGCISYQDKDGVLTESVGRIESISHCELIGAPLPADADPNSYLGNYCGLELHSSGQVGSITDTTITGGYCGIMVRDGSIDSIEAVPGPKPSITGGAGGIFVESGGTIGSVTGYEISSAGGIAGYERYFGIQLRGGSISSMTDCLLSNILNAGMIGQITRGQITSGLENTGEIDEVDNCTLLTRSMSGSPSAVMSIGGVIHRIVDCTIHITAPEDDERNWTGFGIYARQSRIDSVTGCTITMPSGNNRGIATLSDGSIGLIENNNILLDSGIVVTHFDAISNDLTGAIDTLGENTLPSGGVVYSLGTIKQVTAAGGWDASMSQFTADSGWVLINEGVVGEEDPVTTEAELLAALDQGKRHIALGADIEVSQPTSLVLRQEVGILDLGGHTLTVHSHGNEAFAMAVTGSNIYIRNGTVKCPDSDSCTLSVIGGGLNLENATVKGQRPLACIADVRQIDGTEQTVPGRIYNIMNCQILGSDVPVGAENPGAYCGLYMREGATVQNIQGSTITGGYHGIQLDSGTINYVGGSIIGAVSGLTGACAIESSGEIGGLYDNIFRTADSGDSAAVRNRGSGIIHNLSYNQFIGANTIYNEGLVENIQSSGQWSADNKVFRSYSGWTLVNSSGSELTRLDTPRNLTWGAGQMVAGQTLPFGVIAWQFGGLHQNAADVRLYRRLENGRTEMISNWNWRMEAATDGWATDDMILGDMDSMIYLPSGTYFFTVQALGDYTQYENSAVATSPDWTYIRPDEQRRLDSGNFGEWDGEKITFTAENPAGQVYGYYAEFLYSEDLNSMGLNRIFSRFIQTTDNSVDLDRDWFLFMLQYWGKPGYYALRVSVVSSDITQILNSWPVNTPPQYYSPDGSGVQQELDNITATDPEGIKSALKNIGTEALLGAMAQEDNGGIMQSLGALENKMGVEAVVTVSENAPEGLRAADISMTGAALNAVSTNTTVELKVAAPEKEEVLPTMYNNTVTFSMTMTGVENTEKLAVPVQITMPIPGTINPNFLVVLHHRADGGYETVPVRIKSENNQVFAVFYVTGFSDYSMTEERVKLEIFELAGGQGSVAVTAKEEVRLLVASYDGDGRMLGVRTEQIVADGQSHSINFSLPMVDGGTVRFFVVTESGMVPVGEAVQRNVPRV